VDLVVTDIVMTGGVDRVAVAEAFMRKCPATRVILMSGYFDGATLNSRKPRDVDLHAEAVALDEPHPSGSDSRSHLRKNP